MNTPLFLANISSPFTYLLPFFEQHKPADWAAAIIIVICFIGFLSAKKGITRTKKEEQILQENTNLSYEDMQKLAAEEVSAETSHTVQRIHALIKGEKKRRVPSLSELHNLTQNSEVSHSYSSWSRTITSVLVICGIAGSIIGLHGIDFSETKGFNGQELTVALKPSLWAVACTVFLVLVRANYTNRFMKFLNELDRVTVNEYMPRLNFRTKLEETIEKFTEIEKKFFSCVESMPEIKKSIDAWCDARDSYRESSKEMQESSKKMQESSKEMQTCAQSMKETLDLLYNNTVEQKKSIDTLNGTLSEISNSQKKQEHIVDSIESITSTFHSLISMNEKSTNNLTQTISDINQNCSSLKDSIKQINSSHQLHTEKTNELSKTISDINQDYSSLKEIIQQTNSSYQLHTEKTNELSKTISDINQDCSSLKEIIQQIEMQFSKTGASLDHLNTSCENITEMMNDKHKDWVKKINTSMREHENNKSSQSDSKNPDRRAKFGRAFRY